MAIKHKGSTLVEDVAFQSGQAKQVLNASILDWIQGGTLSPIMADHAMA